MTIDLLAHGATVVNVEEIPPHARQFAFVRDTLQLPRASLVVDTMYRMPWFPETRDLDIIVCSGVLYHLSDMIVGLKTLYDCLRAGGSLLLESQVAPEAEHPYVWLITRICHTMTTLITAFTWILRPARRRHSLDCDAEIYPPADGSETADDMITTMAIFCDQRHHADAWCRFATLDTNMQHVAPPVGIFPPANNDECRQPREVTGIPALSIGRVAGTLRHRARETSSPSQLRSTSGSSC